MSSTASGKIAGARFSSWRRTAEKPSGFPVLEDGTISPHGDFGTFPETVVALVHPKELGISEIQWAKP